MSVEVFLDTNVFIYHWENQDERKAGIAGDIIRSGLSEGNACISFQIIQECLNTALRKAEVPLDAANARELLQGVLVPLWRVMPSEKLYLKCLELQQRYRYGFYDSLIIAAALEAGCIRLLSEDLQHGQSIEGLRIENPFV